MMTQTLDVRQAWPEGVATLLGDYPRDAWHGHPNFARSTQNWMGAHTMFRQLTRLSSKATETYIDSGNDDEFAQDFGYYGDLLIRNLHGHHTWEDRSFFPELARADGRFDHGLELLEKDHEVLDETLDRIQRAGNRAIKLTHLDPAQAREEAKGLIDDLHLLQGFLGRHLTDEEDLVVPIILHHKLRG